jgi:REP element-mobilizing transposase RayT
MTRRPRYETPDGVVHVTARGNRRQQIYVDAIDRARFEGRLDDVRKRFEVEIFAVCQMGNHYHMVVRAARPVLSDVMHRLNGGYAQGFNLRHGLDGHLFQDRFHGVAVTSEGHLLELLRYVLLNPVRAGICAEAADWPWSSYRAMVGLAPVPAYLDAAWVLDLFHPEPERARASFAAFVRGGIGQAGDVAA